MKKFVTMLSVVCIMSFGVTAKNITLKLESSSNLLKSNDSVIRSWSNETRCKVATLKMAKGSPSDPTNAVKIVAATVVKNARTKKTYYNDIQELKIPSEIANMPVNIMIATGAFEKRHDSEDKAWTRGWMPEGLVVEYWAGGKMQKRLATFSGPLAKSPLIARDKSKTRVLYLERDCLYDDAEAEYDSEPETFKNRTLFSVAGKILNDTEIK